MSKKITADRDKIRNNENNNPSDREEPAAAGDRDRPREIGGRSGPEPTRYGDWEYKGRCIDF